MTRKWKFLTVICAILVAAGMLAGCSSDDDPSTPVDGTAPIIAFTSPGLNDTDVDVDETVMIMFNEVMDTATVEAAITLSSGAITAMAWEEDDKLLSIEHADWAQGSNVTVTIDDTAADLAGNTLEATAQFSFWVEQTTLVVLDIDPPSGTTGLPRNPVIKLLFSDDSMNTTSVEDATYATDTLIMKATYDVSVTGAENDWYQMTFDQTLPANTTIYVTINTSAENWSGTNLESAYSFQFTTGTEVDTTPPHLIGMVPENGSVIDIYTPYVEFTFDEAVDTDSFEFLGFSVPFYLMVMGSGEPDLLEGGTVLRLPLATPLAAGARLEMLIDSFDDIFGNTQNADLDYSITVGGTPDYYPVENGLSYGMSEYWYEGVIGNPTPTYSGDRPHYYRQTTLENGTFLLKDYTDYTFTNSYEWDIYSKTGSAIMIHGFHESFPMPIKADPTPGIDILFDDPLTWLKLPPRVTTWSESTTMTEPDKKATLDLDVDGRIIEKVDTLPLLMAGKVELPEFYSSGGKADAGLYWNDCWLTVIEHTVSMESEIFTVGVDSVWYAPGFGPVRINSYEENYEGDGGDWDWSRKEWFPVMEGIR